MVWKTGDANRFRNRAEELRVKADGFSLENRKMLLNMAEYYETFARDLEARISEREHPASF